MAFEIFIIPNVEIVWTRPWPRGSCMASASRVLASASRVLASAVLASLTSLEISDELRTINSWDYSWDNT